MNVSAVSRHVLGPTMGVKWLSCEPSLEVLVFSWGWAPERNTPGSNVLLLSGRAKTQKDETVSRGVKEAESRIGTDNSDTDVLPAHLRSWLYL